jgi:hypothetical protein
MPTARRVPLFHAIVVTGAALAGACGKEAVTDPAPPDASVAAGGDAEAVTDASVPDASCPDGSERPVPPCFLIR